jgi:hypothetical protein
VLFSLPTGAGRVLTYGFGLLVAIGVVRLARTHLGRVAVVFYVLMLVGLTAAGRGLGGEGTLFLRHYIPLIAFIAIAFGFGAELAVRLVAEFALERGANRLVMAVLFLVLLGGLTGFYTLKTERMFASADTLWMLDPAAFKEAAAWIRTHTLASDRFMYAINPQDLSYWSDRQVVIDPTLPGDQKYAYRAAEEVKFYNVKYLMVDSTKDIFDRESIDISRINEYYPGLNLELVYRHPQAPIYIFAVD